MSDLRCDVCSSEDIRVECNMVEPHGIRLIAICNHCQTAWINTEPSVVELLICAKQGVEPTP